MTLPFVDPPELVLLPEGMLGDGSPALSIKPFGVLVALGVYVGSWLALDYGVRRGLSGRALGSFVVWVVGFGFVAAHVLDLIFYYPERLLRDPWSLVRLWEGLSSYGGFLGGLLGAWSFGRYYGTRILPYVDAVASGLPVGWLFGRAGCAVVHDHPGIASDAWYAVAFPEGARLDLGLLEFLMVVPIAGGVLLLRRRAWPWGFFVSVVATAYAPLRFGLDFLRVRAPVELAGSILTPDRRYLALTPAQWLSLALGVFGVAWLARVLSTREEPTAYAAPPPPPAFSSDADAERRGSNADLER